MAFESVAAVAGYVALEVASGFLKEHGKEIYHKVKSFLTAEEMISLNLLEKYPDSQELRGEVASVIETYLKVSPEIVREIEAFAERQPSPDKRNEIIQKGNENIAVQDVSGSDIKINQK